MEKELWENWKLFKDIDKNDYSIQLKKQGAIFKSEQLNNFSYRLNIKSPPSIQELYESIINGIIKRNNLSLYQGKYFYFTELQVCLNEFIKILNIKFELLIEIFQTTIGLNLTKELPHNIVIKCNFCNSNIFINNHCNKCYNVFYCDNTCLKNDLNNHNDLCKELINPSPKILYPLMIQIHCGGDLGEDIKISYEDESKLSLMLRGANFLDQLLKLLYKNRWLRSNYYTIEDSIKIKKYIKLVYEPMEDSENMEIDKENSKNSGLDEDIYLSMPIIQELKVIFLTLGCIIQDIVKEIYESFYHYIIVYYVPY